MPKGNGVLRPLDLVRSFFLGIFLIIISTSLSCSKSSSGPNVSDDEFTFSPKFRGDSSPDDAPLGIPLPPDAFKADPSPAKITLTWRMPKIYVSNGLNIGYRLFRVFEPRAQDYEWEFETRQATDWTREIKILRAADSKVCSKDGLCRFVDELAGNIFASYAIIAYWNIDDFDSSRSIHVTASALSLLGTYDLDFSPGFTDDPPNQIIGAVVGEADRFPYLDIFNFRAQEVPWYLLDANKTQKTIQSSKKLASPVFTDFSADGLDLFLPDQGFFRGLFFSRGRIETECAEFKEPRQKELCEAIIISRPYSVRYPVGQESFRFGSEPSLNPLPSSRKFKSSSISIEKGESGKSYVFVADETRILVRFGELFRCDQDPGEEGDAYYGAEGHCGFHASIGTYSPRQRCLYKTDGSIVRGEDECTDDDIRFSLADTTSPSKNSLRMPGAPKIVGRHLYIPDAGNARLLRISNFEDKIQNCGRLLKPGADSFKKATLVLEDFLTIVAKERGSAGNNIRVIFINNLPDTTENISHSGAGTTSDPYVFTILLGLNPTTDKISQYMTGVASWPNSVSSSLFLSLVELSSFSSGKTLANGSYRLSGGGEPSNSLCEFDMVVGQYGTNSTDPDRFNSRDCVRGGERGGFEGSIELPADTAFTDPLGKGAAGGSACRLDMFTPDLNDPKSNRRFRQAGDFRDDTLSDISPETGLMAERTKRMFRAPLHLEVDERGWLYVLDAGITRVRSRAADFESTLPTRLMVWRRDPFTIKQCVPIDPLAKVPSCSVNPDGICLGEGCVDKQCEGAECSAQIFIGQPAELYSYTHETGQTLGEDLIPDAYYPISSFALSRSGPQKGVWTVTGKDGRILHWAKVTQTDQPVIHNQVTGKETNDDLSYKLGAFSGISVDEIGQRLILWDTKSVIGVVWSGRVPAK